MRSDQYYSIGQTAKLCGLSIQTLRYYDKLGLVKPTEVDRATGYRYYSNLNLLHIKIIQDMKTLHFTLEEIGHSLKNKDLAELISLMKDKQTEVLLEIQGLEKIASSVNQRIEQMIELKEISSGLGNSDILVELKMFPERTVIYDRRQSACGLEPSVLRFTELFRRIEEHRLVQDGYILTIYHENLMTFNRDDSDLEFCIPIKGDTLNLPFTRHITAGEYVTALYTGIPNEDSCKRIYQKLLDWMTKNKYSECGPAMEQYIVDMSQMMDPQEYMVELQIPVKKAPIGATR